MNHVECVDCGLQLDALVLQVLHLMLALGRHLFELARLTIRAPKLLTHRIHLIRQVESVLSKIRRSQRV